LEVYSGTARTLRHTVFLDDEVVVADGDVIISIYDASGDIIQTDVATLNDQTPGDEFYSVLLGPDITSDFSPKTFDWSYEIQNVMFITPREELVVVTPYVTFERFLERYPQSNVTYAEFRLVEPVVRKVIDTYCNQTFTRTDNVSYSILGQDSDVLVLPQRSIQVDSVKVLDSPLDSAGKEVEYDITEYTIQDSDDRWSIRRRTSWNVDRKMTPTSNRRLFKYPTRYKVTGSWGWETVPNNVGEAAAILINDYGCADAKYREKYVANIRAGDWRMEFVSTGDETTGNANADMILSGFRNLGISVI